MSTRIFVSVGTDHHPFDRLIAWIDQWVTERPHVSLVVQHGYSVASTTGENHVMMTGPELQEHYGAADIVVSQVGPGTIADANAAGLIPIVVPRDPRLGEVVDDHQYAFGEFMADRGRCTVVTTEAEFRAALDHSISAPGAPRFRPGGDEVSASVAVAELVADLMAIPRRRLTWRRVIAMIRRPSPAPSNRTR